MFLKPPPTECCTDCVRVRQRLAAVCQACAVWYEASSVRASKQLQAVEQGEPVPAMPLPPFEVQLPEGVPEELPPSVDRCSSCQDLLDHVRLLGEARGFEGRGLASVQHLHACDVAPAACPFQRGVQHVAPGFLTSVFAALLMRLDTMCPTHQLCCPLPCHLALQYLGKEQKMRFYIGRNGDTPLGA